MSAAPLAEPPPQRWVLRAGPPPISLPQAVAFAASGDQRPRLLPTFGQLLERRNPADQPA